MSRKRFDTLNCSIAGTLELVGDWWTLLVVRDAFFGANSFTDFRKNLGISRNILTDRLQRLLDAGILEKFQSSDTSKRELYRLTTKGKDLLPLLVSMMQWGDRWINGPGHEPVTLVSRTSAEQIRQIRVETEGHESLMPEQLGFIPGPGADQTTRQRFARK